MGQQTTQAEKVHSTVNKDCFSLLKETAQVSHMTWRVNGFLRLNRPFAAKPARDLLFIKLWAATLRMPDIEKSVSKISK